MEPEVLYQFLQEYGQLLKTEIQNQLNKPVPYAPGYNNDAYSRGRNNKFAGVAPKSPFGIGALSNSIEVQLNVATDSVDIYMLDYWKNVNYGRKDGKKQPPLDPIIEWLGKKGIQGRDKRGRFVTRKSTAFAIARNISIYGIQPTKFYENALDAITELILTRFPDDADTYIDALFGRIEEKNITL